MAEISDNMEVDSTALELADMPVEVLENIFEFLDAKSLKSSRLVSNKWNQIISKSPKLMKKLVLVIDDNRETEFHQILNFSRCYQEIKFNRLNNLKITENIIQMIREIGSKVKKIELVCCFLTPKFEDLIRSIPADHFEFQSCIFYENSFRLNPEVFAGCKSLEVDVFQTWFPGYENLQLTKLCSFRISTIQWTDLINFLAKQTRLSALCISMYESIPPDIQLANIQMQCPVESLKIASRIHSKLSFTSRKLLDFLKLFAKTLKSLEFDTAPSIFYLDLILTELSSYDLLEGITSTFKSLMKLKLVDLKLCPEDPLELLQPLLNIKSLELENVKFETSEEISKFFKLFPQLKEVKLDNFKNVSDCDEYSCDCDEDFCDCDEDLPDSNEDMFEEEFFNCLFKIQHIEKFFIADLDWKEENFRGYFVVLKNKHLSIKIGTTKKNNQRAFDLALKMLNKFDLPKDELMMSQHKAQESPEWKPVTEELLQAMNEKGGVLYIDYQMVSVDIQKH